MPGPRLVSGKDVLQERASRPVDTAVTVLSIKERQTHVGLSGGWKAGGGGRKGEPEADVL